MTYQTKARNLRVGDKIHRMLRWDLEPIRQETQGEITYIDRKPKMSLCLKTPSGELWLRNVPGDTQVTLDAPANLEEYLECGGDNPVEILDIPRPPKV